MVISEGAIATGISMTNDGGVSLTSDPCPYCGVRISIRKVPAPATLTCCQRITLLGKESKPMTDVQIRSRTIARTLAQTGVSTRHRRRIRITRRWALYSALGRCPCLSGECLGAIRYRTAVTEQGEVWIGSHPPRQGYTSIVTWQHDATSLLHRLEQLISCLT